MAVEPLQHLYLALDGDDAGVHLVDLMLPFKAGDHAVELLDALLLLAELDEEHTYLGLGAQGFGLFAHLAAEVGLLRGPA